GEILDLRHGLIPIRELQRVEIGVRHHHVLGLAADPTAHVDVAVGCAGAIAVDVQTDTGLALFTVATATARDVEGDGDDVALLDEFHIGARLDDLAGNFVTQYQAGRGGCATAHHVLVTSADVRGDGLQD